MELVVWAVRCCSTSLQLESVRPPLLSLSAGHQLTRAAGHITIIDHDTIELSNLHRQVLHPESRIGISKALSAALSLSSHVRTPLPLHQLTRTPQRQLRYFDSPSRPRLHSRPLCPRFRSSTSPEGRCVRRRLRLHGQPRYSAVCECLGVRSRYPSCVGWSGADRGCRRRLQPPPPFTSFGSSPQIGRAHV